MGIHMRCMQHKCHLLIHVQGGRVGGSGEGKEVRSREWAGRFPRDGNL